MGILKNFFKLESTGGLLLLLGAFAALILNNVGGSEFYQHLFNTPFLYQRSLLFFINDGLMVIFFLLISLELKRELVNGRQSDIKTALLPIYGALGGMLLPACIYIAINYQHPANLKGWAIPVATDIAFALGVLNLLGNRIPQTLRFFLLSLAIYDDLGAIIIIAFFHSNHLSGLYLLVALCLVMVLALFNYLEGKWWVMAIVGIALWLCVTHAGIHPTIAGVIIGFLVPTKAIPRWESILHPWVAYFILPLFAFANAGIALHTQSSMVLKDHVTLGILLGLFLGKQLGVFGTCFTMIKIGWAQLPLQASWRQLYGIATLCGIGFTMSLFLGTLAFGQGEYLDHVRLGVLLGSLFSAVMGSLILWAI